MKKIIFLIVIIIIYLIYNHYSVNNINYVSISSNNSYDKYIINDVYSYNNHFNSSTIKDLTYDIINNRTIKVDNNIYYLKKVLRESDVLVINIGMEELTNYFNKYDMNNNYLYFNKMYLEIKELINEIKKYSFGKIIYLGYYNPTNYYDSNIDRFFYDINIKLERLMVDNNIIYLDLYELIKGNKDSLIINKKIANSIKYYLK